MLLTNRWVAEAGATDELEFRRAVHTILLGISLAPTLPSLVVMKGAILLAIKYQGDRHTTDMDFSTARQVAELDSTQVLTELEHGLALAVEALDYSVDCRVQSWEMRPKDPTKSFPTMRIGVGYASKGTPRHRRLLAKNASTVVSVEISFNEVITAIEVMEVADDRKIHAYTIEDLVAEKFRAILQQPVRKRVRRQDIYDIYRVMQSCDITPGAVRRRIHDALVKKASARGLTPVRESMQDPKVIECCRAEYSRVADEIRSELPEFDVAYNHVRAYFETLPWA